MLPFEGPALTEPAVQEHAVFNVEQIPKELEIYQQTEADFLPEGKTFEDLTPEELHKLKLQYRFACFRPGIYQGITGFGNSV